MKLLSCCLPFVLGLSFATAQPPEEKKEEAVARDVRFLLAGTRPLPVFAQRDGATKEVDPPIEQVPPDSVEILSDETERKDEKEVTQVNATANTIARLPSVKAASKVRLKLVRRAFPTAAPLEVTCEIGAKLRPLIVISKSYGKSGWNSPEVRVVDLDDKVVPARNAVLMNLTPVPLKVGVDSKTAAVAPAGNALFPLQPGSAASARYRVDAVAGTKAVTIANSAYTVGKDSRLLMFVMPDENSTSPAKITVRLIADPVRAPQPPPAQATAR